jgi:hypothetical protein
MFSVTVTPGSFFFVLTSRTLPTTMNALDVISIILIVIFCGCCLYWEYYRYKTKLLMMTANQTMTEAFETIEMANLPVPEIGVA